MFESVFLWEVWQRLFVGCLKVFLWDVFLMGNLRGLFSEENWLRQSSACYLSYLLIPVVGEISAGFGQGDGIPLPWDP